MCNWQIQKQGHIRLKSIHSEGLWGLGSALYHHINNIKDEDGNEVISPARINTYKDETFEYEQEVDCGCRYYVPGDNLEFLEWKYEQSQ